VLAILLLALGVLASAQANAPRATSAQDSKPAQTSSLQKIDPEIAAKLLKVKRIYVESFGDDKESKQLQAMVIDSLVSTKRFIITENKEKADATLKGAPLQKTSQEVHATSEGTAVRGAAIQDSETSVLAVSDAMIAVRLVSADGDVLWSTAKQSKGAKYKGASADVADEVVKQLMHDIEKLQPTGN
jgi:curli biogenesis system outer membrane secretion channel CsgG